MGTRERIARAWRRVERLAAWFLVPLLVLQFLSGYAILHGRLFSGILSKPTAFRVHGLVQPLTVAAVAIHGGAAIRRALLRRGIRGRAVELALSLIGAGMVAFAIHLHLIG